MFAGQNTLHECEALGGWDYINIFLIFFYFHEDNSVKCGNMLVNWKMNLQKENQRRTYK
jgi:hypothetical protein